MMRILSFTLFLSMMLMLQPVAAHALTCTSSATCSATQECSQGECAELVCASGSQIVNHVCVRSTTSAGGSSQTTAGGSSQTTSGGSSQTTPGGSNQSSGAIPTLQNPLHNINSFDDLLSAILAGVVRIGAVLLVLMLVYVGFLFVVAQGNPEKVSQARSALIWTVIGGLILLGAEAIHQVIQSTVNSITS